MCERHQCITYGSSALCASGGIRRASQRLAYRPAQVVYARPESNIWDSVLSIRRISHFLHSALSELIDDLIRGSALGRCADEETFLDRLIEYGAIGSFLAIMLSCAAVIAW